MTRAIDDIEFTVPLDAPLVSEALRARDDDADWRVIVLPGTPCRKELFYRLLRVAPKGLEVVVLSRPGFGKRHDRPVTDFSDQAKAVEPFLPGKKNIVLGVSYGGALALTAALNYPDQIDGVVTAAALVSEPFDYARWIADLGGNPWVKDFVPQRLHHTRAEVDGRRAQIGPLLDRLENFDKPVEVVHGDFDMLVSLSDAELLSARLGANAHVDKVPGGTHYLELQYPRRLFAAVARVIDRASGTDTDKSAPVAMAS